MNSFKSSGVCCVAAAIFAVSALSCSPATPAKASPAGKGLASADEQPPEDKACGPQAPRDITVAGGANTLPVPRGETPNLCNVHFHEPFEHAGFRLPGEAEAPSGEEVCKSVNNGDQIEFHWVYTNCDLPTPARPGLENCVCDREDMVLRVFAQGYVVGETGGEVTQPSGQLVQYAGSTTGSSYDDKTCSPARVNWEVNRQALPLSKASLKTWCSSNPWAGEDHPHKSRAPVTNEAWLAPFSP